MVERAGVAHTMWQGQHPLAHGDVGDHAVEEPSRSVGHATRATRRANPAALAGEGNEIVFATRLAMHAAEAVDAFILRLLDMAVALLVKQSALPCTAC